MQEWNIVLMIFSVSALAEGWHTVSVLNSPYHRGVRARHNSIMFYVHHGERRASLRLKQLSAKRRWSRPLDRLLFDATLYPPASEVL